MVHIIRLCLTLIVYVYPAGNGRDFSKWAIIEATISHFCPETIKSSHKSGNNRDLSH